MTTTEGNVYDAAIRAFDEDESNPTLDAYLDGLIESAMAGEWMDGEDWEKYSLSLRKRLKPFVSYMVCDFYQRGYEKASRGAEK